MSTLLSPMASPSNRRKRPGAGGRMSVIAMLANQQKDRGTFYKRGRRRGILDLTGEENTEDEDEHKNTSLPVERMVVRPKITPRRERKKRVRTVLWELLTFLCITYNVICLPIRIARFYAHSHNFVAWAVLDFLVDLQLGCDLYLQWRAGVPKTRLRVFMLELVANIPFEWLGGIAAGSSTIPFFRLLKFIRLYRVGEYLDVIKDEFELREVHINASLWRSILMCLFMIVMTHWVTCVWIFLGHLHLHCDGTVCISTFTNWIESDGLLSQSMSRKYARSFYSTTSTLITVGFGDIVPLSVAETLFMCVAMILGAILSTRIIAGWSRVFAGINAPVTDYQVKIRNVKAYLRGKDLPETLVHRFVEYYNFLWGNQKGMDQRKVLDSLPAHLRMDVLFFLQGRAMSSVSFLKEFDQGLVLSLMMALEPVLFARMAFIYKEGDINTSMYMLHRGKCAVISRTGQYEKVYTSGEYFGAEALFQQSACSQTIQALTFSQLFTLARSDFDKITNICLGEDANELRSKMAASVTRGEPRTRRRPRRAHNLGIKETNVRPDRIPELFLDIPYTKWHPNSRFQFYWHAIEAVLLVWFIVGYPMSVAFYRNCGEGGALLSRWWFYLDLLVDIFYAVDLVLHARYFHLFSSANFHRQLIQHPADIWQLYLKGFFWFDLCAVCSLPVGLILSAATSYCALPTSRIMRIFKLMKLPVLEKRLSTLFDRCKAIHKKVVGVALACVGIMHWVGCVYYLIGRTQADAGQYSWIIADELLDSSDVTRYVRALYWAFVVFSTTGYGDIKAFDSHECYWVGLMVLFGGMANYCCVGMISAMLDQHFAVARIHAEKMDRLTRYMKQSGVDIELNHRIRSYYRYLWSRQNGVKEEDIFNDLPKSLSTELVLKKNRELVQELEVFQRCSPFLVTALTSKLKFKIYCPNVYVTRSNSVAVEMFILNNGTCEVLSADEVITLHFLYKGGVYGDVELVKSYRLESNLKTQSFCDFSVLSAGDFRVLMRDFPEEATKIRMNSEKLRTTRLRKRAALYQNLEKKKIRLMLPDTAWQEDLAHKESLISPYSLTARLYSMTFLLFSMYQAAVVPVRFSFLVFGVPEMIVDLFLDVFMWIDIFYMRMSRLVEIPDDGKIPDTRDLVRKQYLSSRLFKLDVISALPLDVIGLIYFLITGDGASTLELIAYLRIPRAFKAARLPIHFNDLKTWVQDSDRININPHLVSMLELFISMLLISHWFGCIFYLIARLEGGLDASVTTWLSAEDLVDADFVTRYLRSLYWSLSSITVVCFGDVVPVTVYESLWTVVLMLVGFFLIAWLIGSMTGLVVNLDAAGVALSQSLVRFNQYAEHNDLPTDLRVRVRQYLMQHHAVYQGIDERAVLDDLPESLRSDLTVRKFLPLVEFLPYFDNVVPEYLFRVCAYLTTHLFLAEDLICRQGSVGDKLYVIRKGVVVKYENISSLEDGNAHGADGQGKTATMLLSARAQSVARDERLTVQSETFVIADHPDEVIKSLEAQFKVIDDNAVHEELGHGGSAAQHHLAGVDSTGVARHEALKSGDMIADIPFFLKMRRLASYSAEQLCECVALTQLDFMFLFEDNDDFLQRCKRLATTRLDRWKMARFTKIDSHRRNETGLENEATLARLTGKSLKTDHHRRKSMSPARVVDPLMGDDPDNKNNISDLAQQLFGVDLSDESDSENPNAPVQPHYAGSSADSLPTWVLVWQSLICVIIIYEMWSIPLRIAFFPERFVGWLIFEYVLEILFAVDIYLHYTRIPVESVEFGFDFEKEVIFQRYHKSFLQAVHILSLLPLEIFAAGQSMFILNCVRLNKMLRLISMSRLWKYLPRPKFLYRSTTAFLKILAVFLMVGHWMSCIWYLTGDRQKNLNRTNWIDTYGLSDASFWLRWLRSIYYCYTAMTTVGYGDITNTNNAEIVFGLWLVIISTSCFSALVATFEASFRDMDADITGYQMAMRFNRHYMRHFDLPTNLQGRIILYYDHMWQRSKGVDEGTVLKQLPIHMRNDVMFVINRDVIERVKVFHSCEVDFLKEIAVVLKAEVFVSQDFIIRANAIATQMYFIKTGFVRKNDQSQIVLKEGDFFGESALVIGTRHKADYVAVTECHLFSLARADYAQIVSYYPQYNGLVRRMEQVSATISEQRSRESGIGGDKRTAQSSMFAFRLAREREAKKSDPDDKRHSKRAKPLTLGNQVRMDQKIIDYIKYFRMLENEERRRLGMLSVEEEERIEFEKEEAEKRRQAEKEEQERLEAEEAERRALEEERLKEEAKLMQEMRIMEEQERETLRREEEQREKDRLALEQETAEKARLAAEEEARKRAEQAQWRAKREQELADKRVDLEKRTRRLMLLLSREDRFPGEPTLGALNGEEVDNAGGQDNVDSIRQEALKAARTLLAAEKESLEELVAEETALTDNRSSGSHHRRSSSIPGPIFFNRELGRHAYMDPQTNALQLLPPGIDPDTLLAEQDSLERAGVLKKRQNRLRTSITQLSSVLQQLLVATDQQLMDSDELNSLFSEIPVDYTTYDWARTMDDMVHMNNQLLQEEWYAVLDPVWPEIDRGTDIFRIHDGVANALSRAISMQHSGRADSPYTETQASRSHSERSGVSVRLSTRWSARGDMHMANGGVSEAESDWLSESSTADSARSIHRPEGVHRLALPGDSDSSSSARFSSQMRLREELHHLGPEGETQRERATSVEHGVAPPKPNNSGSQTMRHTTGEEDFVFSEDQQRGYGETTQQQSQNSERTGSSGLSAALNNIRGSPETNTKYRQIGRSKSRGLRAASIAGPNSNTSNHSTKHFRRSSVSYERSRPDERHHWRHGTPSTQTQGSGDRLGQPDRHSRRPSFSELARRRRSISHVYPGMGRRPSFSQPTFGQDTVMPANMGADTVVPANTDGTRAQRSPSTGSMVAEHDRGSLLNHSSPLRTRSRLSNALPVSSDVRSSGNESGPRDLPVKDRSSVGKRVYTIGGGVSKDHSNIPAVRTTNPLQGAIFSFTTQDSHKPRAAVVRLGPGKETPVHSRLVRTRRMKSPSPPPELSESSHNVTAENKRKPSQHFNARHGEHGHTSGRVKAIGRSGATTYDFDMQSHDDTDQLMAQIGPTDPNGDETETIAESMVLPNAARKLLSDSAETPPMKNRGADRFIAPPPSTHSVSYGSKARYTLTPGQVKINGSPSSVRQDVWTAPSQTYHAAQRTPQKHVLNSVTTPSAVHSSVSQTSKYVLNTNSSTVPKKQRYALNTLPAPKREALVTSNPRKQTTPTPQKRRSSSKPSPHTRSHSHHRAMSPKSRRRFEEAAQRRKKRLERDKKERRFLKQPSLANPDPSNDERV